MLINLPPCPPERRGRDPNPRMPPGSHVFSLVRTSAETVHGTHRPQRSLEAFVWFPTPTGQQECGWWHVSFSHSTHHHGKERSSAANDSHPCACLLSHLVSDFAAPRTVAHQAPLSLGILQARALAWVAMPSSRGSLQPRDGTFISCLFSITSTWEPLGDLVLRRLKRNRPTQHFLWWGKHLCISLQVHHERDTAYKIKSLKTVLSHLSLLKETFVSKTQKNGHNNQSELAKVEWHFTF